VLFLIRHPRPSRVQGLCYGRLDVEVEANALATTAVALRAQIPEAVLRNAPIHTSPLRRCAELARLLAEPREPICSEALLEMDFGAWEGMSWDELPRAELDDWAEDVWRYQPGGGESAEAVSRRWSFWLGQLRQAAPSSVVAVTHAGVIRVALAASGALSPEAAVRAPIEFGSVHRFEL